VTAIVFGVSIISVFTIATPHHPPYPRETRPSNTPGNCGLVSEAGVASLICLAGNEDCCRFSLLLPFGLPKIELKLYAIKTATE